MELKNFNLNGILRNNDELLDQDILDKSSSSSPKDAHTMLFQYGNINNDCQQRVEDNSTSGLNLNSNRQQDNSVSINIQHSALFDEKSIFTFLDQSIQEDIQKDSKKNQIRLEQFDSFKYECEDVLQILSQMSQGLKQFYKTNKNEQTLHKSQLKNIEQIKNLEILATSSMEKVRGIQKSGVYFYESMMLGPVKSKQYLDNLRMKFHNKLGNCKEIMKKHSQKTEDQKFKFQINEYELNQRVSQLEEAFTRQREEINVQANKNEQLKFEKQVLSKNYEQRLAEIEKIVQIISKTIPEDKKVEKINNSFCLDGHHQSLLQPSLLEQKQNMNQNILHQNESQISNQVDTEANKAAIAERSGIKAKSIHSQLKYLQKILKDFKSIDQQQQQEGGSCDDKSNTFRTFVLNQLVNYQNEDKNQKAEQHMRIESSQASVNQAFIGSIKLSDDGESVDNKMNNKQNTSFFGFNGEKKEDILSQNLSMLLSQIISSRRGQPNKSTNQAYIQQQQSQIRQEDNRNSFKQQLEGLTVDEQMQLFDQWYFQNQNSFKEEGNDVKKEDILEISKKTFSSRMSSVRTDNNRNKAYNLNRKDSEQLSILKMLDGVTNIQKKQQHNYDAWNKNMQNQNVNNFKKYENKNNSSLEMSFNQSEIQIVDGRRQYNMLLELQEEEKEKHLIKDDDLDLELDDFIPQRDLNKQREQIKDSENGTINVCDKNISLKSGLNFLSSMNSEEDLHIVKHKIEQSNVQFSNHQHSIEDDINMLSNLSQNQMFDLNNENLQNFPDLSQIEGNNTSHLNTGVLSNIHIEGENGSFYSGGSNLQLMQQVLRNPPVLMQVYVKDRVISMPKLDLKQIVNPTEQNNKFKQNIENTIMDSSSSSSERSYLQSHKNIEQKNDTIDLQHSQQDEDNDLDKNIAMDEDDDEIEECKDLENMFGDLQQECLKTNSKEKDVFNYQISSEKKRNILDEDFDVLINNGEEFNPQEKMNENQFFLDSFEDEKPFFNQDQSIEEQKQVHILKIVDVPDQNSTQKKSINLSMHKKSQSDNQLLSFDNNDHESSVKKKPLPLQIKQMEHFVNDTQDVILQDHDGDEEQKIFQQLNLNMNKLKTPKNGIKINLNQLNSNGQQNCLRIIKSQIRKKRSSSSENTRLQVNQTQIQATNNADISQIDNSQIKIQKLNILGPKERQQPRISNCNVTVIQDSNQTMIESQQEGGSKQFKFQNAAQRKNPIQQKQKVSLFNIAKKTNPNDQSVLNVMHNNNQNGAGGVDVSQVHEDFTIGNSFYQEQHKAINNLSNQIAAEDNESQQMQQQKVAQKKLMSFLKITKANSTKQQMNQNQLDDDLNLKQDDSALIQNYFSAAIVASQKRPSQKLKQPRVQPIPLIEKDMQNPYFQQFSQRNEKANAFSEKAQSSESGFGQVYRHSDDRIVESQEFDLINGQNNLSSKDQAESKQSYYIQSPTKFAQRSSNSCTPQKKILTINKQAIKINPNVIKKSALTGSVVQNGEIKRRLSNPKRINDQSQMIIQREYAIGDQTEIIEEKNNCSIIHNSQYYSNQNNVSQLIPYQEDQSMLIQNDMLANRKGISFIKQTKRSRGGSQMGSNKTATNQSVILNSNIQINLAQQQQNNNPIVIKKISKVSKQIIKVKNDNVLSDTKPTSKVTKEKEPRHQRLVQKTLNESRLSRQSPQNPDKNLKLSGGTQEQLLSSSQLSNQRNNSISKANKVKKEKKNGMNNIDGHSNGRKSNHKKGLINGTEYSSHSSMSSFKDI